MTRYSALFMLFVSLGGCKQITSMIVGGTVSTGKEVTKGIVEGVEEGRKSGESLDGAVIVSNAADLAAHGSVSVFAVRADGSESNVTLAFENAGETPMRVSGVDVIALDLDGFVQRPASADTTLTVPARAKDQLIVHFAVAPDRIKTMRIWGVDYPVPTVTP